MTDLRILPEDFGSNKDYDLTPKVKIAEDKANKETGLRAETRESSCWSYGCDKNAVMWVSEIRFDMMGDKAGANNTLIDTRDFEGPVPGFCRGHSVVGPKDLAEAVYHMKDEFKYGVAARRWWAILTDGTKQGGEIQKLNLGPGWTIKDEHTHSH